MSILLQGRTVEGPSRTPPGGNYHYLSRYADSGRGRLAAAIDAIGTDPAVLFLDVDDALGGGVIVPDNIRLLHLGAATIDLGGYDMEITGSPGLFNADLDDNVFDIQTTDEAYAFDTDTKVTLRSYGDTVYANQTLAFAPPGMNAADTFIERGAPGIVKVTGGVADALQDVPSIGGRLSIDCAKGLNVVHTLSEHTTVIPPSNATAGVHLDLVVFQAPGKAYTIGFDPVFKLAEPFTVSALHFSTIRFVYIGLYWIQMGGAAIDAPL